MAIQKAKPERTQPTSPSDPWMDGYSGFYNNLTPNDLRLDPETGRRRNGKNMQGEVIIENREPNGVMRISLDNGTTGRIIPPLATWEEGSWLSEKKNDKILPEIKSMHERWGTWVVDGEGTPGNYLYRCYELPEDVAKDEQPKHPSKWTQKQRDGKSTTYYSGSTWTTWKPKDDGLPLNLKIRCPGCGHWYGESDLKNHVTSACPGQQGGDTDWIIPCVCCISPDLTAMVKDGYPKQVKAPPAKTEATEPAVPVDDDDLSWDEMLEAHEQALIEQLED